MMSSTVFRLVLLVSCAHALVHVYEISLPSVEQEIAQEYFESDVAAGKKFTGMLSNYWRLLWGMGALVAGWLVDRVGSRPMLAIYLFGCGVACVGAGYTDSQTQLLLAMIFMGALAAIYHPAGLALISHETSAENRPRALGIHGILGSLGIGTAPMLAAAMLHFEFTWRQYFWTLAVPGFFLGFVILTFRTGQAPSPDGKSKTSRSKKAQDDNADWSSYVILIFFALLQGLVYSALMSFLPRYLSASKIEWLSTSGETSGKILAAAVLLLGCFGQYTAGRIARPKVLEIQLSAITFANVPFLIWMALATGWDRAVSAALLALVHFMQQPVYNSLVAKYSPSSQRSLCYGVSFAMAFGLGSFGARIAGAIQSDSMLYSILAGLAGTGGIVALLLWTTQKKAAEPSDHDN